MALSDEERRRLEKLEQVLAAADPNLDRKLQSGLPAAGQPRVLPTCPGRFTRLRAGHRGISTKLTVIGAIGFMLMIAGAHWYLLRRW